MRVSVSECGWVSLSGCEKMWANEQVGVISNANVRVSVNVNLELTASASAKV